MDKKFCGGPGAVFQKSPWPPEAQEFWMDRTNFIKELYLFGSLVNGESTDRSDIDLAVTGIRKEDFFEIFGELMMSLDHPVDLINLEKKSRFVAYLKEKGELARVA
jgi:predicted nucleotidyltransferase